MFDGIERLVVRHAPYPGDARSRGIGNCNQEVSNLRRLLTLYADALPTLRDIPLPTADYVSVDEAREVMRRVRTCLAVVASPAVAPTAGSSKSGDVQNRPGELVGPFAGLLHTARQINLIGKGLKLVEAIAEGSGRVGIADADMKIGGDALSAYKRIKKPLKERGWRLFQANNMIVAERAR